MAKQGSSQLKRNETAVSTVIPLPENPVPALMRKAVALQQAGQFADAIKAYDKVLKASPRHLAALVNKGVALRRAGRQKEAMACFWQALSFAPDSVEAWHNAGNTLLDLERFDEAEAALKAAMARAPEIADIWVALSRLLLARKQFVAADFALTRAIAIRPDPETRLHRATLWLERGQLQQALDEFLDLQTIIPQSAPAHTGAGQTLLGLGRLEEARSHLEKGVELDPNHLDGQLGLARYYLLKGDFEEGWKRYEWRLKRWTIRPAEFTGPEWDGSDPAGKTILVYGEQGFGDTIQFLRYLPLLAARGARIIMFCQKALVPLVQQMDCVAHVSHIRQNVRDYDFHVALMSLPFRMDLGKASIPANVPYLKTQRQAQMPVPPLGTRLRVGLVWAGSATHPDDHNRSVGLLGLLPLAGIDGVRLYSLQVGPRAADIETFAHPALIQDFSKHLKTFADTAAVIDQLDLVIAVDTSTAHLAGALGKPVWTMLPNIPDWRWQIDHGHTPWYPTMRLYRQGADGDWKPVVWQIVDDLARLAAETPLKLPEPDTVEAVSVFGTADRPRFRMSAPRALLDDPGVGFLMRRERAGVGYEYATRALLDAHLEPGDLFLDIGAHWGIMTMQAATRWAKADPADNVQVIAFEPSPDNAGHLRRWVADNAVENQVEVIEAAVSDRAGSGTLKPESTMGYGIDTTAGGAVRILTIDEVLAKRSPDDRRVVIKIDVEGHEPEVLAGMTGLLTSGRVALLIWERGVEYGKHGGPERLQAMLAKFKELGFSLWRFASEDAGGSLEPFVEDGRTGNVIAFPASERPLSSYGLPRPKSPEQPADPLFDIGEKARALYQAGTQFFTRGKDAAKALALYAEAGALDNRQKDLYNNLGVLLKDAKPVARTVAYRRAHALAPDDAGIMSNLANALREENAFEEAKALHERALAIAPNNPGFIYNAALVYRDSGQPDKALPMFDRVLELQPDHHDCRWDRALILLQMGDYARGMPAYESRWNIDRAHKRATPLPRWDGSPLDGRSIFLHDEQGFGDVMQFARFIPELKKRGAGKVVLECQPELMRLMLNTPGVDAVIPRERFIPQCDVYNPLLSLPGIFGTTLGTLPNEVPYLFAPDMAPETRTALPKDGRRKVGIVWAGQLIPRDRSCPLDLLLPVLSDLRIALISLQVGDRADDLKALGAEAFVTDMSSYLKDFAETASVMSKLDLMITIDTSVAHLAGALGIPTLLLLRRVSDWRWFDESETSPWYPTFKLFRQGADASWGFALSALKCELELILN